jgi:uncharacterized protein
MLARFLAAGFSMPHDAINADDVAGYLRAHPDFLQQHPEVLQSLNLPRQSAANTTSLAAYQLDVLREKNQQLLQKLNQLIQIAGENELLVQRVHLLALRLLKSGNLHETLQQIGASLQEDFHTDLLRLCLIDGPDLAPHQDALRASWIIRAQEGDLNAALGDSARHKHPICGRLRPEILQLLFAERAAIVASAVLLPLEPTGVLAVGSDDPNRFHPGMGTTVLEMIAELIKNALAMQLDRAGAHSN